MVLVRHPDHPVGQARSTSVKPISDVVSCSKYSTFCIISIEGGSLSREHRSRNGKGNTALWQSVGNEEMWGALCDQNSHEEMYPLGENGGKV